MLMAHQDVVAAEPSTLDQWTHPPFEGRIVDGFIWGRGTLDIKNQLIGIFEAAEMLLQPGLSAGAHGALRAGPRRGDRRGQWLQGDGPVAPGARRSPGRHRRRGRRHLRGGGSRRARPGGAGRRQREGIPDDRDLGQRPARAFVHAAAADRHRHPGARPGAPRGASDADPSAAAAADVPRHRPGSPAVRPGRHSPTSGSSARCSSAG